MLRANRNEKKLTALEMGVHSPREALSSMTQANSAEAKRIAVGSTNMHYLSRMQKEVVYK
jgi:hypothetical protein